MSDGDSLRAPIGTRDVLPPETARWEALIARFAGIGVVSTLAYVALYAGLRFAMAAQLANALALLATAIANTAANRRLTFDIRGRRHALRHQVQGLGVFAVALAVTSTSLAGLRLILPNPGRGAEITVLVLANLCATVLRFVLLSRVFRSPTHQPTPAHAVRPTAPTTRALLRGIRSLP